MYREAASDPDAPGACEAALAAARLAGTSRRTRPWRMRASIASSAGSRRSTVGPSGALDRRRVRMPRRGGGRARAAGRVPAAPAGARRHRSGPRRRGELSAGRRWRGVDASRDRPRTLKAPQIVRVESWPGRDTARVVVVLDRPAPYRIGDEPLAGDASARTFLDLDGVDLGRRAALHRRPRRRVARARGGDEHGLASLARRRWSRVAARLRHARSVSNRDRRRASSAGRRGSRAVAPSRGWCSTPGTAAGTRAPWALAASKRRTSRSTSRGASPPSWARRASRWCSLATTTASCRSRSAPRAPTRSRADLFVSIHCNASEIKTRRGVETYVLDTSRDEIAARVAARENATTQAASADLTAILGDMRLADQSRRSTRFAQLLDRSANSALQFAVRRRGRRRRSHRRLLRAGGRRHAERPLRDELHLERRRRAAAGSDEYRQVLADADDQRRQGLSRGPLTIGPGRGRLRRAQMGRQIGQARSKIASQIRPGRSVQPRDPLHDLAKFRGVAASHRARRVAGSTSGLVPAGGPRACGFGGRNRHDPHVMRRVDFVQSRRDRRASRGDTSPSSATSGSASASATSPSTMCSNALTSKRRVSDPPHPPEAIPVRVDGDDPRPALSKRVGDRESVGAQKVDDVEPTEPKMAAARPPSSYLAAVGPVVDRLQVDAAERRDLRGRQQAPGLPTRGHGRPAGACSGQKRPPRST